MGIFEKFKIGFKKSASTFTSGLRDIIVKKEIDDKTLNEVEDYLIESDVGVAAGGLGKTIAAAIVQFNKASVTPRTVSMAPAVAGSNTVQFPIYAKCCRHLCVCVRGAHIYITLQN